jgi:GNAT superfamily N-acetyltransferase
MPAMLDDPTAAVIYRTSGEGPYPTPYAPLPINITPRQVTLRDRSTTATLVPFSCPDQVPKTLLHYLCALLNREIEKGDTYPMMDELALESFGPYWFANFGAVMLLGEVSSVDHVWQMDKERVDWSKQCLGSFYIKPNYPGRSSHVCNGGFLVSDVARNRGVGRLMGEGYLEWAPLLGFTYSVFNLVYETNIASARIWDALGFKRIGRVPGCGNLKSSDHMVDAIIFGRDLNGEAEDYLSEERFDKIRYYLKTGNYPNGADRAEKSRLRSAGAHYRIVVDPNSSGGGEEMLMLKDKQVISDPQKQYEIALKTHAASHAGINKTTAAIAERYHWIRIKETVSQAIRNCANCKESAKPAKSSHTSPTPTNLIPSNDTASSSAAHQHQASPGPQSTSPSLHEPSAPQDVHMQTSLSTSSSSTSNMLDPNMQPLTDMSSYPYDPMPVDPQIMSDIYGTPVPCSSSSTAVDPNNAFSESHPVMQQQQQQQQEQEQQQGQQDQVSSGHGGIYGAQIYEHDADAQLQAELMAGQMARVARGAD